MPISGLVVTLSANAAQQRAALESLRRHPAIEIGEAAGGRLPIVVETGGSDEDQQLWQWLHELPGVTFVDVACIHFEHPDKLEDSSANVERAREIRP